MSVQFQYQIMTADGGGALSTDGGRTDVYLYTGAGAEIEIGVDTPYSQMIDTDDDGVYRCTVSKSNIYSVVAGGVILTGDEGVKIDADPARVINLDANETIKFKWSDTIYAEIGRGTSDTDIIYLRLRNANGDESYIIPNSTNDGVLNEGTDLP